MTSSELLQLSGSILLSIGGGAAIVAALSRWLGGVWAGRILKEHEADLTTTIDALTRRRNIYSKLVTSLRVLLRKHEQFGQDRREEFLASYDEAAVWAPDEVMNPLGDLIDLLRRNSAVPGSVLQPELEAAYVRCVSAIRRDAGFYQTEFRYRVVSF
jgi:hypothetical protein